ncbi:MAG: DUF58 domain-containing protein [Candidatus Marinimicrobia bacterium]|nr:DUF58 domain-containing protein [Candidatus Neomarinimicrobiota bacterium]MBT3630564.1 DUF58 domain-containing protein [Candidatus Neomarinimicrobiota bacterium]MBT3823367.1 DUF58 domain-containing protein [Candidatus Neomarinimicrobiota bacterium]MBT4131432.1 DUF58 domain-containing protein [Candidatus Neomarinimicrobiota bacterium]MBT4295851.1 DUF58 domain-containing protein [Candidatus Neomarinimicrobiota bacterium]
MLNRDLLKKVKKIELSTRHLVNEVFGGEYHSVFKGRGMEFAEVREYSPGDDIRTIDWNVSARTGVPYVKLFEEERELTVMILVDASASGAFGTRVQMKRALAAELSAVLAFSAVKNNDKVGLIIFTDHVEKYIPPRKGRSHVLRVIREVLNHEPEHQGTSINTALEFMSRVIRKRSVTFMISDFLDKDYERSIKQASRKHDMLSFHLQDPWEIELPNLGLIQIHDGETGETSLINTGNASLRQTYQVKSQERFNKLQAFFKSSGLDYLPIRTDVPYVDSLISFFRKRASRRR